MFLWSEATPELLGWDLTRTVPCPQGTQESQKTVSDASDQVHSSVGDLTQALSRATPVRAEEGFNLILSYAPTGRVFNRDLGQEGERPTEIRDTKNCKN